jgi:hypothetical protein
VTALDRLLDGADHVVIAAPLTAETRHLLDENAFRTMKVGVHLVNVSRGALIDQDALRAALDDGTLAPGERLPKETVLAHQFGVEPRCVRNIGDKPVEPAHIVFDNLKQAAAGFFRLCQRQRLRLSVRKLHRPPEY